MALTKVRVDIQILRAAAVLAVIVGHFWPGFFPGGFTGVDVFFVISGFLITSLMLTEIDRTGRLSLVQFWARRIRRILPAAFVVLASTVVAVLLIGSPDQIRILSRHVIASSLSAENLLLSWDSVDYDRREDSTSPLQHFWSLAVEEQFYVVWPLIVGLVLTLVMLSRHFRLDFRKSLASVILIVTGASFVYALSLDTNVPASYFDPFARAWELGVGATIAVWGGTLMDRARRSIRAFTAVVSWGVLVGAVLVPQLKNETPGFGVLPSVLATAALIAVRVPLRDIRSRALQLGVTALRWIGDRSYSLYLWHWPFLILTPLALGSEVNFTQKIAILVGVGFASMLSFRYIEQPFKSSDSPAIRQPRFLFPIAFVSTMALIGATSALAIQSAPEIPSATTDELIPSFVETPGYSDNAAYPFVTRYCFGAGDSVFDCPPKTRIDYRGSSVPRGPEQSATCAFETHRDVRECILGNPQSTKSIALVGDSHARANWAMFDTLGKKIDVAVHYFAKNACAYADTLDPICETRNEIVRERMLAGEFEFVVFVQSQTWGQRAEEAAKLLVFEKRYRELVDRGVPFVVIKDNPRLGRDAYECLQLEFRNPTGCAVSRDIAFAGKDFAYETATELDVPTIDFTDLYCDESKCPLAIGGVVVYFDYGHITPVFGKSLVPFLYNDLRVLGFLPITTSK